MVDFSKMMKRVQVQVPVNPIDIYANLDLTSTVNDLRDVQKEVLSEWFSNHFDDKDIIVKLHTGDGKTLTGLLMLQSRLNKGLGPCLYVCPNKQLARQASDDARKFGIKHILLEDGDLPAEFLDSKQLMITHVQKVFNGLTHFGLDNNYVKIGTFVLDDSHACVDSIRASASIRIPRTTEIFKSLLQIFQTSLRKQGEGSYYEIVLNDYSQSYLTVPYWDWVPQTDTVLQKLVHNKEEGNIKFVLPLIQDRLAYCTMYVSSRGIEITPYYPIFERFGSFCRAGQRILMSATTQDDSFLIRGLGINRKSIEQPLSGKITKWAGEKMILFPSIIDDNLTTGQLRQFAAMMHASGRSVCSVLVPGFRLGKQYEELGCVVVQSHEQIVTVLNGMKNGQQQVPVVFANRYDGIDLPDDMCRILVIDSLPSFDSLADRYEVSCRDESDLINIKIAQKIEQGLGRSVRSERDFSVILIIGADIVRFMQSQMTRKYFSAQTNQQILIGETVAKIASEEKSADKPLKPIYELMGQCLTRNPDWKQYYKQTMDEIQEGQQFHPMLDLLEKEREADISLLKRDLPNVCKIYSDIVNRQKGNEQEQGWYMQELAKYKYHISPSESVKIQKSAYELNQYVLAPDLVTYKKISILNDSRIKNILQQLSKYPSYVEFKLYTNELLANLSFGVSSKKFEQALQQIGLLLGFGSQRPDNEIKMGPDNLWALPNGRYVAIECKNDVDLKRSVISKTEAGQMEMHCGWFEQEYGAETPVKYYWIHPTKNLAEDATLTHVVSVITPQYLENFKKRLTAFFNEFSRYEWLSLTDESINQFLVSSKLDVGDIMDYYSTTLIR